MLSDIQCYQIYSVIRSTVLSDIQCYQIYNVIRYTVLSDISMLSQRGTFAFQPVFFHVTQLMGCFQQSLTIESRTF